MKVKKLKTILQKCDDNMDVCIDFMEDSTEPSKTINQVAIILGGDNVAETYVLIGCY